MRLEAPDEIVRRTIVDNGWLLDRTDATALRLDAYDERDGHIVEGVLRSDQGDWYPIEAGVPCLLRGPLRPDSVDFQNRHALPPAADRGEVDAAAEHVSTIDTFSDKWKRFRNYGMDPAHQNFLFDWYCKKLGVADQNALAAFYRAKQMILEVGAGSGFNSRFMAQQTAGHVVVADISQAAETAYENTWDLPNCHVLRADLMDLPLPDAAFDLIMADGVLHHTPNTRHAVGPSTRSWHPAASFSSTFTSRWVRRDNSVTDTCATSLRSCRSINATRRAKPSPNWDASSRAGRQGTPQESDSGPGDSGGNAQCTATDLLQFRQVFLERCLRF